MILADQMLFDMVANIWLGAVLVVAVLAVINIVAVYVKRNRRKHFDGR